MEKETITIYAKYKNGVYFFGFTGPRMARELMKRGYKTETIENIDGEVVKTVIKK